MFESPSSFQKHFKWLGRQSLDFYIESLHLAIECQGEQHFKPINFFGGNNALTSLQERDIRKKQLCEEHGIKLFYYTNLTKYDIFLDEQLIKTEEELLYKIKQHECNTN